MSKILTIRHACGSDFLENVLKTDCSLERIYSGTRRSLKEFNLQICDQRKTLPISLHALSHTNMWRYLKDILPSRRGLHQLSRPTTLWYITIYRIFILKYIAKWKMHFWTSHDDGSGSFTLFFLLLNMSYYPFFFLI